MVARSVRWRSGTSRAPPVRSGRRCSSRERICSGVSAFTRAAASSSASGRSSRRRQISDTERFVWKSALTARARARKKPTPSSWAKGGTAYSCSALRWSGSRLVTSSSSRGHSARSVPSSAAASTTCSKLSRRRRSAFSPMWSASESFAPSTWPAVGTTSAGSRSGASGTQKTPSR